MNEMFPPKCMATEVVTTQPYFRVWCWLASGHDGVHEAPAPEHGPLFRWRWRSKLGIAPAQVEEPER